MPANAKTIKTRIKSVKNTKKITKAMEMVSAAKMRKSVDAALRARMYGTLASELLENIAHLEEPNYALLERRPVEKMLMIVITSNRGLCGSFNANVLKKSAQLYEDRQNLATQRNGGTTIEPATDNVQVDVLGIGKKSASFAKKHNLNLVGVYEDVTEQPQPEDLASISNMIVEQYKKKEYDKVALVFTHFVSSLTQEVKVRQLLPVASRDLQKMIMHEDSEVTHEKDDVVDTDYLFEPDLENIVEYVIPRLVDIQLYQAVLESSASEHSARMMAMKNASEAAGDMITSLTLTYNKARQASITQEIAEIAGGAAALE